MRKMFFSLVATLAFGSFAMANTIELLPVVDIEVLDVLEKSDLSIENELDENENCQEEYSDLSNCIQWARNYIINAANAAGISYDRDGGYFEALMIWNHSLVADCMGW
jgi:hypothetical protein